MKNRITENTIEEFAIELLERLGYKYIYAPDLPVRCTQTGIVPDGIKTRAKLLRRCFANRKTSRTYCTIKQN